MKLFYVSTTDIYGPGPDEYKSLLISAESAEEARTFAASLTGSAYGYFAEGEDVDVTELSDNTSPALLMAR